MTLPDKARLAEIEAQKLRADTSAFQAANVLFNIGQGASLDLRQRAQLGNLGSRLDAFAARTITVIGALVDALAASEAARERFKATLQFYADRQRWSPNSYHIISAHEDRGDRARAALAADAKEGSDGR